MLHIETRLGPAAVTGMTRICQIKLLQPKDAAVSNWARRHLTMRQWGRWMSCHADGSGPVSVQVLLVQCCPATCCCLTCLERHVVPSRGHITPPLRPQVHQRPRRGQFLQRGLEL